MLLIYLIFIFYAIILDVIFSKIMKIKSFKKYLKFNFNFNANVYLLLLYIKKLYQINLSMNNKYLKNSIYLLFIVKKYYNFISVIMKEKIS